MQEATEALLENEHLSRVIGRALQRRLDLVASELSVSALGAVAPRADGWWPALVRGQVESVRALADEVFAERVAESLTNRPSGAPTQSDWRAVLELASDLGTLADKLRGAPARKNGG